jgi:hypothetical protein
LSPAFAQTLAPSDSPFPAPTLPKGVVSSWSSLRAETKAGNVLMIDTVAANNLALPAWIKLEPGAGCYVDGTQTTQVRFPKRETVTPQFALGVDLKPEEGAASQTFISLYGFCELRYESARGRLSFIVWQAGGASSGDARRSRYTKVDAPITAGKWSRVVGEIANDKLRLRINGVVTEVGLTDTWELAAIEVPVLFGNASEGTRPFYGRFNHLYFAELR